jgi:uncharacterized DUF497 family protein
VWLKKLIVADFIKEKIWEKHQVSRLEVEECLVNRRNVRLRHKKNPARSIVLGATENGRLLKIILEFQGQGRYFLITALEMEPKEKRRYGKKIKGNS